MRLSPWVAFDIITASRYTRAVYSCVLYKEVRMRRGILVAVGFGVLFAFPALAGGAWYDDIELLVAFRRSPGMTISNFPESIRDVPLHRDDEWLVGNTNMETPLPDTLLPLPSSYAFDFRVEYHPTAFTFCGALIAVHSSTSGGVDSDERYQRNQYGDSDRGVGTSLRWYETDVGGAQVGVTAGLGTPWISLSRLVGMRLSCGGIYDLTGFSVQTTSGWDRWGSDEKWRTTTLARCYEHRVFSRFDVGLLESEEPYVLRPFIFLESSVLFPELRNRSNADISCPPYHDVRFSVGFGFSGH
jgi:hypothetical protein